MYLARPRVLIELADPDEGLELASAINGAGCTVTICRAPADPAAQCPLLRLEPCVAVAGSDLVVSALDFQQEESREVLRGLRTRYGSTPIVVEATTWDAIEMGDTLSGCTVLPVDHDPEQVAAAVLAALPSDSRDPAGA